MKIAVLDIGGTSIKAGMFEDGCLDMVREYDTNAAEGGAYVIERAKEIIREYKGAEKIGISTAGQVDSVQGIIRYANSNIPGYTGMRIKEIMENTFGIAVEVENDVNAAAMGEAYYGAGKEYKDFLCLTYGTGVGGAIVINGEIYKGSCCSAGEMGGIIVHPEDRRAKEDIFSGCYERYASATALVRKIAAFDSSLSDGRKIFAAISREDVRKAVDEWIEEIVCGLTSLIHIFNPPCIVLGGGIMREEYILQRVRERTKENIMDSFRDVSIVAARLGNKAGMYGAAGCVLKKILKDDV